MNNSYIIKDNILEAPENIDNSAMLRQQEQELLEVIEAIKVIRSSSSWKVLETKMLRPTLETATRKLIKEKDLNKIFHIQGQIEWLQQFADINKVYSAMENSLKGIKNSLKKLNNG